MQSCLAVILSVDFGTGLVFRDRVVRPTPNPNLEDQGHFCWGYHSLAVSIPIRHRTLAVDHPKGDRWFFKVGYLSFSEYISTA